MLILAVKKKQRFQVFLEAQFKSQSSSVKEGAHLAEHSLKDMVFGGITCQAKQRCCNKPQVNGEECLMD